MKKQSTHDNEKVEVKVKAAAQEEQMEEKLSPEEVADMSDERRTKEGSVEGTGDSAEATPEVELTAEERLALLQKRADEKIAELQDNLLRTQAEFENRRKRLMREKEEAVQFANASFAEDLIGLIDNIERALSLVSADESNDFVDGMRLVEKDFLGVLSRKWGLERMDGLVGQPFDPEKHEACLQEAGDVETETVAMVLQSGYTFRGRILRHAKVKVTVPQ